ncbi:hypothetical protein BGZ63DRAFT_401085 [Mariannaea sp. PMI_226]|nr:hypothetical protein BGZ63DRAFT_401085 [Mariannaea sp. PMI_226]
MESITSQTITTTPTATVPKSTSKQLTYTTAGTLYNPNTSHTLQPPTRRGRNLKFAPGGTYSGLSLFPKGILASLSLQEGLGNSLSVPQYTPLQQNYHRAISPLPDTDHVSINMSAKTTLAPSGTTLSSVPSSLFSEVEQDKSPNGSSTCSSDDEVDFGMDPLMNMSVKSLHNLASYPNPNQKKARKVLRGVKPTPESATSAVKASVPSTPCTPLARSFAPTEILKKRSVSPISLRPARSDPAFLYTAQDESHVKPDLIRSATLQFDKSHKIETVDQVTPALLQNATASITLSSGPGAPQPLTAGPPGQRQYRPSTFESTFKALRTETTPRNISKDEDQETVTVQRTLLSAAVDELDFLTESTSPILNAAEPVSPEAHPASLTDDDVFAGIGDHDDSSAWNQRNQRYDGTFVSTWDWPSKSFHSNYASTPHTWEAPVHEYPWRLTKTQVAARNEKINRDWYSGAGLLDKSIDDLAADTTHRKRKNIFGAVGDGRPMKPKDPYAKIQIAEANGMSTAKHAEPLLNMAYASILQHVETETYKSDPSEMEDDTEFLGEDLLQGHVGKEHGLGNGRF